MARNPNGNSKIKTDSRVGITVVVWGGEAEEFLNYPTAVSWGLDGLGTLAIGVPGTRQDADGRPINDTIAVFANREWRRVYFTKA